MSQAALSPTPRNKVRLDPLKENGATSDPTTAVKGAPQEPNEESTKIIDFYEVLDTLYVSALGTEIHLGVHKLTGEHVVMKVLDKKKTPPSASIAHVKYYSKLNHPHIARCLDVFDTERLVFVLEAVDGMCLDDYLSHFGMAEAEAREVMQQLLHAVKHCHENGIAHRNISLRHVMLHTGAKCCVKLLDFASCGPVDKKLSKRVGNPLFAAPEMFKGEYVGRQTDLWALGVVLHVMLCGAFPFTTEEKIKAGKLKLPSHLSADAMDLLVNLLHVNPTKRFRMEDALAHKWFATVSVVWPATPPGVVDTEIVAALGQIGLGDEDSIRTNVKEGVHGEENTTYFLLRRRRELDANAPPPPEPIPDGADIGQLAGVIDVGEVGAVDLAAAAAAEKAA